MNNKRLQYSFQQKNVVDGLDVTDSGFNAHSSKSIDQGKLSQWNNAGDKTFTSFVSNITKLAWGAGWFWVKGHLL